MTFGTKKRALRSGVSVSKGRSLSPKIADMSGEMKIGTHLRHARLTKGLSLRQLAEIVECSESFISKIENDHTRPSLAVLHRLVSALEINVASLFAERGPIDEPVLVIPEGKRPVITIDPIWKGRGIRLERLIPNAKGVLLQANIHDIDAGGGSDGSIEHEGEEVGYILDGELELIVDGKHYSLKRGDSFFFPSHLPHAYRNAGKKRTRVLWVNTPPTF